MEPWSKAAVDTERHHHWVNRFGRNNEANLFPVSRSLVQEETLRSRGNVLSGSGSRVSSGIITTRQPRPPGKQHRPIYPEFQPSPFPKSAPDRGRAGPPELVGRSQTGGIAQHHYALRSTVSRKSDRPVQKPVARCTLETMLSTSASL
ncbi:hypothetical protein N7462_001344 [Penicillium macrosclerotiorum]|uniref:uncharacterized protein n=1 Tax=Penicillium macrosclerotiorum TaxID=303699 RepID=UPI0025492B60|nr:uncharacterized protein N7462_001344 [Penicillium macrosclerotiorum]KAJ5691921.1 hypothetical protein N7462_001344 [Penicillium macrosclerotiorum]